jgi:hypothetical protein
MSFHILFVSSVQCCRLSHPDFRMVPFPIMGTFMTMVIIILRCTVSNCVTNQVTVQVTKSLCSHSVWCVDKYWLVKKYVIQSYVALRFISLFRKAWFYTLHETVQFSALLNTSFIEDERCVRSLLITFLLVSLFFIEILHYKDFLITVCMLWDLRFSQRYWATLWKL